MDTPSGTLENNKALYLDSITEQYTIYSIHGGNMNPLIDDHTAEIIRQVLRHGNSVELKKEQGKLVVVELQRKVRIKTTLN